MFFALRRSRHTTSFFAENPRVGTFYSEVTPHDFLFRSQTAWLGAKGVASKGIPCGFSSPKGIPHGSTQAKMRAKTCPTVAVKCEQSEPRLHSSGTLLPFPNAMLCSTLFSIVNKEIGKKVHFHHNKDHFCSSFFILTTNFAKNGTLVRTKTSLLPFLW